MPPENRPLPPGRFCRRCNRPEIEQVRSGKLSELSLEVRVAKLEAIEAIRALKKDYARYCDDGYGPGKISRFFTEDAVWDSGEHFGVHRGHEEIDEFFEKVSTDVIFAVHYVINGVITVDDDLQTARGHWYLWEPVVRQRDSGPTSVWIMGSYDDEYAYVDGAWKFAHTKLNLDVTALPGQGWHEKRFFDS
jgi:hypothetical protein